MKNPDDIHRGFLYQNLGFKKLGHYNVSCS